MSYLIKFVSKIEYAEDLMNGVLFSNSIHYYSSSYCPKRIRDRSECTLTFKAMIKTSEEYRYSYSFYESETNDLNKKEFQTIINKYRPEYAVIIDKDRFIQKLEIIKKNIKDFGRVNYCDEKTIDYSKIGFNKHISFRYLNEYRILFKEKYEPRFFKRNAFGLHGIQEYKYNPSRDGLRFEIGPICDIAYIQKL